MSDTDTAGDPTPSGGPDDESIDIEDVTTEDVTDLIEQYRHELGAAQADAMEHLEDVHDIENERDLYERTGFTGEAVTLEIKAFDAELYVWLDLLDRLTDSPQAAESFVPQARLLDALLDALPSEVVIEWLKRDMEATDPVVEDRDAPTDDVDDSEGSDE